MLNLMKSTAKPGKSAKSQVSPVLCDLRRPGPLQTIDNPQGILMFPAWGRQCPPKTQKCWFQGDFTKNNWFYAYSV